MSYFLESYEDKNYNTVDILEDYTGMNEILFNAEMAWGNIMESAMINEYKAIKNEDVSLLEDTKNNFFEKVKQWFKDLFASISRVITNIKSNILYKLVNYSKWARKIKKELGKRKGNKDFKFYCNFETTAKALDNYLNEIHDSSMFSAFNTLSDKDTIDRDKKELEDNYNKYMKMIKEKNETTYNTISATNIVNNCLNYLDGTYKKDINSGLSNFELTRKACKTGISIADRKEDKERIKFLKSVACLMNMYSSRYLNLAMKYVSLNVSFVKKFIAAAK